MGEIFIIVLLIGLIISFVKIFRSKKTVPIKILFSFFLIVSFCFAILLSIGSLWERGRRPKLEDEGFVEPIKVIYFINKKNQSINVVLNFEYTKKEISNNNKINLSYNKLGTIFLRGLENKGYQTPILHSDSLIKFPANFNIKIKDSLGKILKIYDKKSFFNSIEKSEYTNQKHIESKETSWTLKIN